MSDLITRPALLTDQVRTFLRTPKGSLLAVFLVLFGVAAAGAGWQTVTPHVLLAVAGAMLSEWVVGCFDRRPWRWPSSAVLSGMIVAFVLGPATTWPQTVAIGILATLSKYLFATSRWHLFNPAALALAVSVPLFGTGQSWWGALPDVPWPFLALLVLAGAWIVDRINKFPLVLTYLGCMFALLLGLSRFDAVTAGELLRPPFVQATLFLALFMLTDPPTAPSRYVDQVVIGALVAVASVIAELLGAGQAYLLVGLLLGNLALSVRRWMGSRRANRPTVRHAPEVLNRQEWTLRSASW
jgi:Na+-translocating ferredoxin:NAD+ oxidoreductase RnfD subunit